MKITRSDKPCKHKFEPRYHEEYTTPAEELAPKMSELAMHGKVWIEPYLKTRTYVWDICVRCGDTRRLNL